LEEVSELQWRDIVDCCSNVSSNMYIYVNIVDKLILVT
jgi:hypothetical protein